MKDYCRLDLWKRHFPLRPGPLTDWEREQAIAMRAEWILQHPLHNAISDWDQEEREYFEAVGRLIEESAKTS